MSYLDGIRCSSLLISIFFTSIHSALVVPLKWAEEEWVEEWEEEWAGLVKALAWAEEEWVEAWVEEAWAAV